MTCIELAAWGETGVLCVETIGKIRRRRLVQGESISVISDRSFVRGAITPFIHPIYLFTKRGTHDECF